MELRSSCRLRRHRRCLVGDVRLLLGNTRLERLSLHHRHHRLVEWAGRCELDQMIQVVEWLTMSSMMDETDILVLPEIVSPFSLLAWGHCGPGLDPVPQAHY